MLLFADSAQVVGTQPATQPGVAATQPAAVVNHGWWQAVERIETAWVRVLDYLPTLLMGILLLVGFVLLGKLVRWVVTRIMMSRGRSETSSRVAERLTEAGIVFLGFLVTIVLVIPSFTAASLVQVLGIGSVAAGFAFGDVLQNFLAGLLIFITEPFRIGDQIKFGDFEGEVEDIQTRATFLVTFDGRRVVIPNTQLFTNAVIVNTVFPRRRLEYDVGIGYGDDVDRARELILQTLREVPEAIDDPPPEALVHELAGSSVTIRARWWINPPRQGDLWAAHDAVVAAIKKKLNQNGIDMPFNTTQVLFHDQTEETDGDRARQREGWPAGSAKPPPARKIADAVRDLARAVKQTSRGGPARRRNEGDQPARNGGRSAPPRRSSSQAGDRES